MIEIMINIYALLPKGYCGPGCGIGNLYDDDYGDGDRHGDGAGDGDGEGCYSYNGDN